MIRAAYKLLLRLPRFRGRHRIESLLRRGLATPVDRLSDGLWMHLDPLEWTQISLLAHQPTEPVTARLIGQLLRPGDTFVDIGSHVGWLSMVGARAVGKAGRVIAVDPQPYNCERVMTNALLNGFDWIDVVPAAASDSDGFVRLSQQSGSDKARLTIAGDGVNDTGVHFLCACVRLDGLLDRLDVGGEVRLLKIDVEGHELEVLRGAGDALDRVGNVIYEALPETSPDVHGAIVDLLRSRGFVLSDVNGAALRPGAPLTEANIWARRTEAA